MAGLVDHLRRRKQLGVVPRHRLGDAGGADQCSLLAMHELRQAPVLALHAELQPLLVAPALEQALLDGPLAHPPVARRSDGEVGGDLLLVHLNGPVEVRLGVPLAALGLLVQLVELRAGALLVLPREDRVEVRLHREQLCARVTVGQ